MIALFYLSLLTLHAWLFWHYPLAMLTVFAFSSAGMAWYLFCERTTK